MSDANAPKPRENDATPKLTPVERAMLWERMSGQRLTDTERAALMAGAEFTPPQHGDGRAVSEPIAEDGLAAEDIASNEVTAHYAELLRQHAYSAANADQWIRDRPVHDDIPSIRMILTFGQHLRVSPRVVAALGESVIPDLLAPLLSARDHLRGLNADLWEGADAFAPWLRAVVQASGFVRYNLDEPAQLTFLLALLRVEMRVLNDRSVKEWAEVLESQTKLFEGDELAAILRRLQGPAPSKMVFEGKLGVPDTDDGGQAEIFEVGGNGVLGPEGMFVRLHSWSEDGEHPIMDALRRRKVRITVEVIGD